MNTFSKKSNSKGNPKNQNSDSVSVAQSVIQFIKSDTIEQALPFNTEMPIVEERGEMATMSPSARPSLEKNQKVSLSVHSKTPRVTRLKPDLKSLQENTTSPADL